MKKKENKLLNFTLVLLSVTLIYIIFYKLSDLIIPLIVAFLIAFAIIGLNNFFRKKFHLNFLLSSVCSLLVYALIIFGIWSLVGSNVEELNKNMGSYQEKMQEIIINLKNIVPSYIDFDFQKYASKINLQKISQNVAAGLASLFSNIGLIFFYVIFMLFEYKYFNHKLSSIFEDKEKKQEVIDTIEQVRSEIGHYFYMKSIISFFTAFLSYLVLISFGLDFAIFWAVFIFILNFVPNIGSIIAVSFPILLALFQFGFDTKFIFLSSLLIGVQIFMGNVIEPKYMGNRLNLSPLVILVSLVFWGNLWGVAGMFLSVPIMIILNIAFSKIEQTRWLAILLSEKGEIKEDFLVKTKRKTSKMLSKIKNKFSKK